MNPIAIVQDLRNTYTRYLLTRFLGNNEHTDLYKKLKNCLNSDAFDRHLLKMPILEAMPPYNKGESLTDLVQHFPGVKLLVELFKHNKGYDVYRPLYSHQVNAIKKIADHNLIVASGTGSGKTECFLFPLIQYCLECHNNGLKGVKALIIYPLNALVEDQMERLGKYLNGSPITFGKYTGQTPRDLTEAKKRGLKPILEPNHKLTRQDIRESAPDILITNYAMLEYIMLRPGDSNILTETTDPAFRFIVLDEAHTYSGSQGTEVSFLLRRLRYRLGKEHDQIRYIGTSATLGTENEPLLFAKRLFDAHFSAHSLITGMKEKLVGENRNITNLKSITCDNICAWGIPSTHYGDSSIWEFFNIVPNHSDSDSQFIFSCLSKTLQVYTLQQSLEIQPETVNLLAHAVFPEELDQDKRLIALITLVSWCDFAKNENGISLIPARYHVFISQSKGLYAQLQVSGAQNIICKLALSPGDILNQDAMPFEVGVCKVCGEEYFVGVITPSIHGNLRYKPIATSYFEVQDSEEDGAEKVILHNSNVGKTIQICTICGGINHTCRHVSKDHITMQIVLQSQNQSIGSSDMIEDDPEEAEDDTKNPCCLRCGMKNLEKKINTLRFQVNGSCAPLISSLFSHAPIMDDAEKIKIQNNFTELYGRSRIHYSGTVADGRKLLIFSDSRQDAAYFGPYLQVTQSKWRLFKYLVEQIHKDRKVKSINDWFSASIEHLHNENKRGHSKVLFLDELRPKEDFKDESTSDTHFRRRIMLAGSELLIGPGVYSYGIEAQGYAAVSLDPNNPIQIEVPELKMLTSQQINALAQLLLHKIRRGFGVKTDYDSPPVNLNEADIYFKAIPIRAFSIDPESKDSNCIFSKRNEENQFEKLIRKILLRFTGLSEDLLSKNVIQQVIKRIITELNNAELSEYKSKYVLDIQKLFLVPIKNNEFLQKIPGGLSGFRKCTKCGRLNWIDLAGICCFTDCGAELDLERINNIPSTQNNHYRYLLDTKDCLLEFRSVEHTAQLDKSETASTYQTAFKDGRINILSCSTTFEMGVDLGDLNIVFLRNVPPGVANYIQRAGRAGRRIGASPLVVTFCRTLPHDQYYFENTNELVNGTVKPPSIVLNNEKILKRHCNAIILGDFFSHNQNFFKEKEDEKYQTDPRLKQFFGSAADLENEGKTAFYHFKTHWLSQNHSNLYSQLIRIFREQSNINSDIERLLPHYFDFILNDVHYGLDSHFFRNYFDELKYYRDEQKKYDPSNKTERPDFDFFDNRISNLENTQLIQFLSAQGALPSYAFPTNVVPLQILDNKESKSIDLSRELDRAISEYAPGAEVVANSKIYTSGGLKKFPTQQFAIYHYYFCEEHRYFIASKNPEEIGNKYEDHINKNNCCNKTKPEKAIFPEWGFVVPRNHSPRWVTVDKSPKKSGFGSELYYHSSGEPPTKQAQIVVFNKIGIDLEFARGYNIFRINKGGKGYTICLNCGRSIDPNESNHLSPYTKKNYKCNNSKLSKNVGLISQFDTDLVRITFNNPPSLPSVISSSFMYRSFWRTVLYSMIESISRILSVDRDDLDGLWIYNPNHQNPDLIVFDAVSGGAGHVGRLLGLGGEDPCQLFESIIEKAVSILNCTVCDPESGCYACIFHHSNQKVQHTLNRGLALEWLNKILNKN